ASNGRLYGMTYVGGTNSRGTLFEFNIKDSVFIKKMDFNNINGARPYYTQLLEINTLPNSIEENNPLNSIDIFPNPTKGITYLKTNPNEKCKIRSLEVYNAFGEQLYNVTQLNNLSIDLSSQPNGIYIIKVGSEIKKVVKF
ncbi:MAG TPA: T9SS type A sorting domain-containing protein, partial [Bacteroidia bacterium]|nr:T9SS type A sorting domain-containing protein [Bacteroidia bacterium]